MAEEKFDIVNDKDEIVGTATRREAHENFLCHRVASVWFYNSKGEVLLQERSSSKDTFPGTYGISVSGHIEHGQSVQEGALREILEESGLSIEFSELAFLEKKHVALKPLNHMANFFAYKYAGEIRDLVFDTDELDGFDWVHVSKIYDPTSPFSEKMHPFVVSRDHVSVLCKLAEIMEINIDKDEVLRHAKDLA